MIALSLPTGWLSGARERFARFHAGPANSAYSLEAYYVARPTLVVHSYNMASRTWSGIPACSPVERGVEEKEKGNTEPTDRMENLSIYIYYYIIHIHILSHRSLTFPCLCMPPTLAFSPSHTQPNQNQQPPLQVLHPSPRPRPGSDRASEDAAR